MVSLSLMLFGGSVITGLGMEIPQSTIKNQVTMDEALQSATIQRDIKKMKILIEEGANVNMKEGWLLLAAATFGHAKVVELLLDNSADIHADDDAALRYSAANGHTETVALLLERGANIHADNDGAFRFAARNGYMDTVAYLYDFLKFSKDQRLTPK